MREDERVLKRMEEDENGWKMMKYDGIRLNGMKEDEWGWKMMKEEKKGRKEK